MKNDKIQNQIALTALALGAVWLYADYTSKQAQQKQIDSLTDPNSGLARSYLQAINPSGFSLMKGLDGTDTAAIFALAAQTSDFAKVVQSYSDLGFGNLIDDLTSELTQAEFLRFKQSLGQTPQNTSGENAPKRAWWYGQPVIGKNKTNMYRSTNSAIVEGTYYSGERYLRAIQVVIINGTYYWKAQGKIPTWTGGRAVTVLVKQSDTNVIV